MICGRDHLLALSKKWKMSKTKIVLSPSSFNIILLLIQQSATRPPSRIFFLIWGMRDLICSTNYFISNLVYLSIGWFYGHLKVAFWPFWPFSGQVFARCLYCLFAYFGEFLSSNTWIFKFSWEYWGSWPFDLVLASRLQWYLKNFQRVPQAHILCEELKFKIWYTSREASRL